MGPSAASPSAAAPKAASAKRRAAGGAKAKAPKSAALPPSAKAPAPKAKRRAKAAVAVSQRAVSQRAVSQKGASTAERVSAPIAAPVSAPIAAPIPGRGLGHEPTVSPEAAALWQSYFAQPCDQARNLLVEYYQGLVRDIVRRFAARLPRNVDRGDLLTAANVGLISAIGSFDPGRGVRFEAYGERRIKGALLDELRAQDWLPRPWRHRIEQHKRTLERLRSEHGRAPLDGEVAAALELPLEEYQLLFGVGLPGAPTGSMSLSQPGEETGGGLDVVPDPRGDEPTAHLTRDELLTLVASRLTDQEYRIVYLYYWEDLPMREIGALTGLSESRICKIHMQLIDRLKARLRAHAAES